MIKKFLAILFCLQFANELNSTIGKIKILSNGSQKIIFFYDIHYYGKEQRNYPNDADFKQAFYTSFYLNKFFKNRNHLSIIENAVLTHRFAQKDNFLLDVVKSVSQMANELYKEEKKFMFLINLHIMCHSNNLPIINAEFRHVCDTLNVETSYEYLKTIVNNKLTLFDESYIKKCNEILEKNKTSLSELEKFANYLFDDLIINDIAANPDKKYIFIFAGHWHLARISKILSSKYSFVYKEDNVKFDDELIQKMDLAETLGAIKNDMQNFIYKVENFKPIDIQCFFEDFVKKEGLDKQSIKSKL